MTQIYILYGQTLPLRHKGDDVRKQETVTTIFTAVRKSLCLGEQISFDQLNIRNCEIKCTVFVSGEGGRGVKKWKRMPLRKYFSLLVYRRLHKQL